MPVQCSVLSVSSVPTSSSETPPMLITTRQVGTAPPTEARIASTRRVTSASTARSICAWYSSTLVVSPRGWAVRNRCRMSALSSSSTIATRALRSATSRRCTVPGCGLGTRSSTSKCGCGAARNTVSPNRSNVRTDHGVVFTMTTQTGRPSEPTTRAITPCGVPDGRPPC